MAQITKNPLLRFLILCALALGLFLASAEYFALNVALPTLARTMNANEGELALIVDAYGLTSAGLLIPGGSLGDRFGRRRAFVAGLAVLAIGALWAAWAVTRGSIPQLIGARAVMGIGAAGEIPSFMGSLRTMYTTEEARRRISMSYSAVIGVGVVTGPVLGGWAIDRFGGIRSVFLGTAAIAVFALLVAWVIPNTRDKNPQRTDLLGAALAMGGLGALLWAVIEAPSQGWGTRPIVAALVAGVVALVGFAWRLPKAKHPLIDRDFVASRRLWAALIAITVAYAAIGGTVFALAQQLQVVDGYTPLEAGLRQTPARSPGRCWRG